MRGPHGCTSASDLRRPSVKLKSRVLTQTSSATAGSASHAASVPRGACTLGHRSRNAHARPASKCAPTATTVVWAQPTTAAKVHTTWNHGGLLSLTFMDVADGQFENALVCPGDDPANCYTSLEASPTPRGPVPDATNAREESIGNSRTKREIVMEDEIEGSGEFSGGSGSGGNPALITSIDKPYHSMIIREITP